MVVIESPSSQEYIPSASGMLLTVEHFCDRAISYIAHGNSCNVDRAYRFIGALVSVLSVLRTLWGDGELAPFSAKGFLIACRSVANGSICFCSEVAYGIRLRSRDVAAWGFGEVCVILRKSNKYQAASSMCSCGLVAFVDRHGPSNYEGLDRGRWIFDPVGEIERCKISTSACSDSFSSRTTLPVRAVWAYQDRNDESMRQQGIRCGIG